MKRLEWNDANSKHFSGVGVQEHVKTMVMCQDYDVMESMKTTQTNFMASETDMGARRALWNQWARDINDMDTMIELRKM